MSWEKVIRGAKASTDNTPELRISKTQITINLVAMAALGEPSHIDVYVDTETDQILIVKGTDFKISSNGGGRTKEQNWGKRRSFRSSRLVDILGNRLGDCIFIKEDATGQVEGRTVFGLVFKAPKK